MNPAAADVVFAGLLLLFVVAAAIARILARCAVPVWIAVLLPFAVIILVPLAGARWIGMRGNAVSGLITAKDESLHVGEWGLEPEIVHQLTLVIATEAGGPYVPRPARLPGNHHGARPRDAPDLTVRGDLAIDVDESLFDAVRKGESIGLHLLRLGPLEIARIDAEPWWNIAPGLLERLLPAPAHAGPQLFASAEILEVRTVREADAYSLFAPSGDGTDPATRHVVLSRPYDEVRLRFLTPGGAEILTIDRVDSGSAGRLQPGAMAMVDYPANRPRTARLVRGTRTFSRTNGIDYWTPEIAGVLGVLGFIGVAFAAWIRYRRRQRRAAS